MADSFTKAVEQWLNVAKGGPGSGRKPSAEKNLENKVARSGTASVTASDLAHITADDKLGTSKTAEQVMTLDAMTEDRDSRTFEIPKWLVAKVTPSDLASMEGLNYHTSVESVISQRPELSGWHNTVEKGGAGSGRYPKGSTHTKGTLGGEAVRLSNFVQENAGNLTPNDAQQAIEAHEIMADLHKQLAQATAGDDRAVQANLAAADAHYKAAATIANKMGEWAQPSAPEAQALAGFDAPKATSSQVAAASKAATTATLDAEKLSQQNESDKIYIGGSLPLGYDDPDGEVVAKGGPGSGRHPEEATTFSNGNLPKLKTLDGRVFDPQVITRNALGALLATETMPDDGDEWSGFLDGTYTIDDIDRGDANALGKAIYNFVGDNIAALEQSGLPDDQIGDDIVLTANGHGAGFWDRDIPNGQELSNAVQSHFGGGGVHAYVGDDDAVHLEFSTTKSVGGQMKINKSNVQDLVDTAVALEDEADALVERGMFVAASTVFRQSATFYDLLVSEFKPSGDGDAIGAAAREAARLRDLAVQCLTIENEMGDPAILFNKSKVRKGGEGSGRHKKEGSDEKLPYRGGKKTSAHGQAVTFDPRPGTENFNHGQHLEAAAAHIAAAREFANRREYGMAEKHLHEASFHGTMATYLLQSPKRFYSMTNTNLGEAAGKVYEATHMGRRAMREASKTANDYARFLRKGGDPESVEGQRLADKADKAANVAEKTLRSAESASEVAHAFRQAINDRTLREGAVIRRPRSA